MGGEEFSEFPLVRRGYDVERVEAHLGAVRAELDRLAAENRRLHRELLDATATRDGITAPVRAELAAARSELQRLVTDAREARDRARRDTEVAREDAARTVAAARAERDRTVAELETARAELDRLLRARVDVHRELAALADALRRWVSKSTAGTAGARPLPAGPAAETGDVPGPGAGVSPAGR